VDKSDFGRLQRRVGRRLHANYRNGVEPASAALDETAKTLAEEGFKIGISDQEIAWLASTDAENVWPFGVRLGELDVSLEIRDRIVAFSSDSIDTVFLAAYFIGW